MHYDELFWEYKKLQNHVEELEREMKRYSVEAQTETRTVLVESPSGKWVRAEDHTALEDAYSKTKSLLADMEKRYAALLDEVETLREANDDA